MADYTEAHRLLLDRGAPAASAQPLRQRAEVYLLLTDHDKALADATEAIRLDPEGGAGYLTRGKVYAAMGNLDRAKADRVKAIQLNPDLADDQ